MTRNQRYLALALDHVEAVRAATSGEDRENKERRRIYGGLCHAFPVMVRTNGLCQALAFVAAKAGNPAADPPTGPPARALAYRDLRNHVAAVLDPRDPLAAGLERPDPLKLARDAALTEYLRQTTTILDAWVYYRRFAVSVLEIPAAAAEAVQS